MARLSDLDPSYSKGTVGGGLHALGRAIERGGDFLVQIGDDFGDWVRGEVPEVPGGTLVTTWADTSKYPLIYGTRKTAGRIIHEYIEDIAGDPVNEILHQVVIYCEGGQHGIEGFEDHYFNEVAVSTGEFDGFYEAHPFTGAPGEILPQVMRDNLPQWTAAHTLDGLAGVYYRLRWKGGEGKQPFSYRPNYLALVNGCKIQRFDEGAARFSTDPLEIIWDYLRAQRYGWNFPAAYLASVRSEWQAQSDFANQIVQSNGVDRALMTCNVFIDLNRNRKQILDILRQDFRIGLLPRLGETVPVIEKDQGVVRIFHDAHEPVPVVVNGVNYPDTINYMASPNNPEGWHGATNDNDGTITNVEMPNPSGESFMGLAEVNVHSYFAVAQATDLTALTGDVYYFSIIFKLVEGFNGVRLSYNLDNSGYINNYINLSTQQRAGSSEPNIKFTALSDGAVLLEVEYPALMLDTTNLDFIFQPWTVNDNGTSIGVPEIGHKLFVQSAFFGKSDGGPALISYQPNTAPRDSITERPTDITKRLNRVTVRWNDAAQNYKAAEYTYPEQVAHEALVVSDGGRILQKTITSHCIDNEAEAKQLAFVILNRSRHDQRLRIPIFSDDFDLEPTDLVQLSNSDLQIVNGIYEIKIVDLDKAQIEVIEHHPSDYPWQGYSNDNPTGGVVVPDLSKRWCDDVTAVALVANNHTPPSADDDLSTLTVTVTPPSDLNYSHAQVRYRLQNASAWQYSTTDANPSVNLVVTYAANAIFEVQVRSISQYELASEWIDAGTVNLQSTNGALPTINNLTLTEGFIFSGKDAHATWDTGVGALPQYFNFFEVQITNTSNAVLNTYTTTNRHFNYSFTNNQNDGAGRAFKIKVRCVSRTGDKGIQTTISVNNPVPSLPAGTTLTGGVDFVRVDFAAITDLDFKNVKIWVSNSSGFTAIEGQQAATTTDNQITLSGLNPDQNYYVRLSIQDVFHGDEVGVLSGEFTQATAPDVLASVAATQARGDTITELALLRNTANTLAGIVDKKELIVERTKVVDLTAITDTQATKLVELSLETDTNKNSITQLDLVTESQALSIDQVNTDVGANKAEATNALNAQTGYCSIADHTTQGTCEAAGGTWTNEPLALALLNAKFSVAGSEVSAGSIFETLANNGALKANASLFVDVDGTVAGVFLGANATSSSLILKSENLKVKTASGTKTPFSVTGDVVEMVDVLIKSSINLNDQFTVDSLGNVNINSGSFTGSLNAAGGRLRASKSSFITVTTPNRTDDAILVVDSSDMAGVAGIVGVSKDTYGGYFYSESGDGLRGISELNDGVNGTASVNGKAGVRASNENGPQMILSNNNATSDIDSGTYTASNNFPTVTLGGVLYTRKGNTGGWFFGYEVSGTKLWGRLSFPSSHAGGSVIP